MSRYLFLVTKRKSNRRLFKFYNSRQERKGQVLFLLIMMIKWVYRSYPTSFRLTLSCRNKLEAQVHKNSSESSYNPIQAVVGTTIHRKTLSSSRSLLLVSIKTKKSNSLMTIIASQIVSSNCSRIQKRQAPFISLCRPSASSSSPLRLSRNSAQIVLIALTARIQTRIPLEVVVIPQLNGTRRLNSNEHQHRLSTIRSLSKREISI